LGGGCFVVPDTGHQLGTNYVAPILSSWLA